jgi:hypothetical protein
MEDRALKLKLGTEFELIGDIAIMGDGDMAMDMIDDERLGVMSICGACGAISYVANGDVSLSEAGKMTFGEDLFDKA